MKISRNWLQTYFDAPLPDAHALGDALTFHAFEIESIEGDVLDVKVTPNRGHDCLSHRGIAKELSAILKLPLKNDPLTNEGFTKPLTPAVTILPISIENHELCPRYIAGYIRGVKVDPSPAWLIERLEAIGQRSINNIVDAGNFVMFSLGQPLHAFDAAKVKGKKIIVRQAREGKKMTALDGKEYILNDSMLVIADSAAPIGIAGVKGGVASGIDESTTDIIIESANFDGVSVRKTAQALKLRTDASQRFEQVISPELAAYGMRAVVELILELAGGEVVGFVDVYPNPKRNSHVSVSLTQINKTLGTTFTTDDVSDVFNRLGFVFEKKGDAFLVTPPFERLDLTPPAGGPEDLIEEVARIIGYDKIPATELPPFPKKPEINPSFYSAEKVREELVSKGYSEVYTSVFADTGERAVANKVDSVHPYLRANLADGLSAALERNIRNKDLFGLKEVKLFEIGTVWRDGKETVMVGTVGEKEKATERPLGEYYGFTKPVIYDDLPLSTATRYQPFSKYPYIVRDISLWVPNGTEPVEVLEIIKQNAGELLVESSLFDKFKKGDKTSYAFHLVFQSFERTLTDGEVNTIMERVSTGIQERGWQVR